MEIPKHMRLAYAVLCLLLFIAVALRSWLVPMSHDEVATFYFYVQPGEFFPFYSHVDANGHFLTSGLGWICFKMFGSSPFSLRLPSLVAFCVLCYTVFRMKALYRSAFAWWSLVAMLLLTGNLLVYYNLCRGYPLAFSALVLSVFYLLSYVRQGRVRHALKTLLFMQISLAASLTMLPVVVVCSGVLALFMLKKKPGYSAVLILSWLLHVLLIVYWAFYGFYLRQQGALYYGEGDSYYVVTFRSLIRNVFGESTAAEIAAVSVFILLCVFWCVQLLRRKFTPAHREGMLSIGLLFALMIVYFLLNRLLGVNYPEDRTGLFFYAFFALAVSFTADVFRFSAVLAPLFLVLPCHLLVSYNTSCFPWVGYVTKTIPPRFVEALVEEEQSSARRITVAGHRMREFIFGFLNYRSSYKLSHITSPEELRMNADFAIAEGAEAPWYKPYYDEIDRDDCWGFRLLKRKTPITRVHLVAGTAPLLFDGSSEFYNCLELRDTVISDERPLEATIDFEVLSAPAPFKAWFVLEVQGAGVDDQFVRIPLDLVRYKWTGTGNMELKLVTSYAPKKINRLVLYLWNQEKASMQVKIHSFALDRLEAPGISEYSKAQI